MEYWTPKGEGSAFELSPILEPLAPFRNQMLVLSGLKANWNYIHAGASGSFLTGTTARRPQRGRDHRGRVDGPDPRAGSSRSETQVASLELAMDPPNNAGACTGNLSCVYTHTISLAQRHAAAADGVQPARGVREAVRRHAAAPTRRRGRRGCGSRRAFSIRSPRSWRASGRELGPQDQAKVNEYTESIRDVERRIQKAEEQRGHRAADARAAAGRAAGVRGSPGADARSAAAGAAVGSDARHLVHDRQGTERAAVSADRRARSAPSAVASQQPAGADRAHVEDQPLSHAAVLEVPGEAARDARRRRLAARPHDDPLRLGHLQQQRALGRQPADPGRGRRRRDG